MQSTMMNMPLTLIQILERAGTVFPHVEVVSRLPDKSIHRSNYGEVYRRARKLAEALQKAGLKKGDRVATLMWNHYAHLEAYFGIPAAGGVLHTLNLRLFPDDIAYIVNHAEDRFLIVDDVLLPLLEKFQDKIDIEKIIVFPFSGQPVPAGMMSYEDFIAESTGNFEYPQIDENDACGMCYTSGTTGNPKGVVYSHRSQVIHSLVAALPDGLNINQRDVMMPVVPMFHVNAWGLPYTTALLGCKQVYAGPHMDGESLLEMFQSEQVTTTAGVPTLWLGVINVLSKDPGRWKLAPGIRLISGGSATPLSLIKAFDKHGMEVVVAWGMTETSPLGSVSKLSPAMEEWPEEKRYEYRAKAGLIVPLLDARVVNEEGVAPWDGKSLGELQVRSPWVTASYYSSDEASEKFTADGWFCTGDVANISPEGFIHIADRTKDLIKSGGEWISSVELENEIMGHPGVAEAAVIAMPHEKWQERPMAVVVAKPDAQLTKEDILSYLDGRVATWWLPDDVVFVDELPHTSTGKLMKRALRDKFADGTQKAG
jgi:fatty-acyl-CoA synthase